MIAHCRDAATKDIMSTMKSKQSIESVVITQTLGYVQEMIGSASTVRLTRPRMFSEEAYITHGDVCD